MRPYGMWTCADSRQVLFNRRYRPILERRPGQPVRAIGYMIVTVTLRAMWYSHHCPAGIPENISVARNGAARGHPAGRSRAAWDPPDNRTRRPKQREP
jgi:hypothetical protein